MVLARKKGGKAPEPEDKGKANKQAAIEGLTYLFTMIINKVIKVDLAGFDLFTDTKNFRGVIMGLGGPAAAAKIAIEESGFNDSDVAYCATFVGMSSSELAAAANNSEVMTKVYGFFRNIYVMSTRSFAGIRINTADQVARGVAEYRASIRRSALKAMERRKIARAKLGL